MEIENDSSMAETAAVDSWQHKVLLASHYVMTSSDKDDSFSPNAWFHSMDNASHGCPATWLDAPDCSACEMNVLLRWSRILFYKVARTYLAAPLLLMLLPLTVGLVVGLLMGRTWERTHEQQRTKIDSGTIVSSWMFGIMSCIWNVFHQEESLETKEDRVRTQLKSDECTERESGVELEHVPKHVAVIMDGNRRYGRARYGNVAKGHWDGSKTLVDFSKWCIAEGIQVLTVYAFSTENWNRDPAEVASLMAIFAKYCDELRVEAMERNIRIRVLSTETERIPAHVKAGLRRMVEDTKHCENGLTMNICLSYGSRGELVNACRSIATNVADGSICAQDIDESLVEQHLLTNHCVDPDVVIRTSGEYRLSNFLLWQLAYAELFFVPKQWPELEKSDLLQVIRTYANGRRRRFGK